MPINFSDQDKVIIDKIQSYCLYQDRCIKEVKNKLFSLKVNNDLGQKIINHLIDNDYLNEERFVKLFIQGKLRIKKNFSLITISYFQIGLGFLQLQYHLLEFGTV